MTAGNGHHAATASRSFIGSLRAALNHRIRYRVTGGGTLYFFALLLVGSASFLTANNLLFLVFSAMLAILLVSGFLSRLMLSGLELELLLPEHVWARTAAPARIRLRNLKRITPSFSLELTGQRTALSNSPPILTAPVYFPVIPGRTTVEAPVDVTFPHRGRHKENVFLIATRFPFGFLRKTTTLALQRETIVYPAPEPFPGVDELLDLTASGETEMSMRGQGRDFYRIRPYEPGDSARHMDWKISAHTGVPHVREFSRDEQGVVEVFLDRRTEPGNGLNYANAFDFALKMMETSYVVAERFSAADFLHGPIAIVDSYVPVFLFAPAGPAWASLRETLGKLRELKAKTVIVTDRSNREAARFASAVIRVPALLKELYTPIPYIIPAQLFAAALSEAKGLDADHPRGLRKVTQNL